MARNMKARQLAGPQVEEEGELVSYCVTWESGKLREVRQLLDDMLPEKERARNRQRDPYLRTYRMYFGGGDWQGEEAAKVHDVIRHKGLTLEFWPDGVALRFVPFSYRDPFEDGDDGEV